MDGLKQDEIRQAVRAQYAGAARGEASCCATSSCCGSSNADELSAALGYSADELGRVPEGANLGLGCGNPRDLPDEIRQDRSLYTGCMAGASSVEEIEAMLKSAGFSRIRIARKGESKAFIQDWAPGVPITDYVVSATIEAVRP